MHALPQGGASHARLELPASALAGMYFSAPGSVASASGHSSSLIAASDASRRSSLLAAFSGDRHSIRITRTIRAIIMDTRTTTATPPRTIRSSPITMTTRRNFPLMYSACLMKWLTCATMTATRTSLTANRRQERRSQQMSQRFQQSLSSAMAIASPDRITPLPAQRSGSSMPTAHGSLPWLILMWPRRKRSTQTMGLNFTCRVENNINRP